MELTPAFDQDMCSSCGKRPATNYICYGGTGKSAELCDECMISEDPVSAAFTVAAKSAKCVHCGGSPCGGGPDTLAQLTGGITENRWMCMSCSREYYSVIQTEIGNIPDGLSNTGQVQEMQKVAVAMDRHMREFVRHRGN